MSHVVQRIQEQMFALRSIKHCYRALELHRMLDAKGGQGLNSMSKTVIGLHLAANQAGVAVDSQAMSKVNDQLILVYQWWKSAAKHFFHLRQLV